MSSTCYKTFIASILSSLLGILALFVSYGAFAQTRFIEQDTAVLRTLDKVTARAQSHRADLNSPLEFGSLVITVRSCQKTPPEEKPESAAFLEIEERLGEGETKLLFSGWMFASSPGVSALEHGIYDVWLLACVSNSEESTEEQSGE